MERDGKRVVSATVPVEVSSAGGRTYTVRLLYRADDPCAVTLVPAGGPNWTFARDLLFDAYFEPVGEGDVRAWIDDARRPRALMLRLSSPNGCAELRLDAAATRRFLNRSRQIVARGAEDLTVALTRFLESLRSTDRRRPPNQ